MSAATPKRIDHAASARAVISPEKTRTVNALEVAVAQVHATLALVEQQRITSLIAIYSEKSSILAELGPDSSKWSMEEKDRRWRNLQSIREQIREGLGLS